MVSEPRSSVDRPEVLIVAWFATLSAASRVQPGEEVSLAYPGSSEPASLLTVFAPQIFIDTSNSKEIS